MNEDHAALVSKLEEKIQELCKRAEQMEQAVAALRETNRELEQCGRQRGADIKAANQELESLYYSVSHDLRAPLRHVRGYIDLVLRDAAGKLAEDNLKHLRAVQSAAQKMGELMDGMLELSRLTQVELQCRPVDLGALAAEIGCELRRVASDRMVTLEISPGLKTHGDARLLRIALDHLLSNAWKFTQRKTDARIEFGKAIENGVEFFFIQDNGVGFDMAYAGKLFGAFQRLHVEMKFEGLGIGLAIAQRIIRRHHGRIWAKSAKNEGATFYFTLGEREANEFPGKPVS